MKRIGMNQGIGMKHGIGMKLEFAVLGLLLLFPSFSFADVVPPCSAQEDNCMSNCCSQVAGGTPDVTSTTAGCTGGDQGKFDTCVSMVCRPNLAECKAPGSTCALGYSSCFTGCRNTGETNRYCDDLCWNQAEDCISNANNGPVPACCGSILGLLGIAGAALVFGRKS